MTTLNLYGQVHPTLLHTRRAALACLLLAIQQLLLLAGNLLSISRIYAPLAIDLRIMLMSSFTLSVAASAMLIVALVVLARANVAGNALNPWPFRFMIAVAGAAACFFLAWRCVLFFRMQNLRPMDPNFFWYFFPLLLMGRGCGILAGALGLVYVLQLSFWIPSRNLAATSALLIPLSLLVSLAQWIIDLLTFARRVRYVGIPNVSANTYEILLHAAVPVSALLAFYFLALAWNLNRRQRFDV